MILNNKYYIQDIESGEYEEVTKEYYEGFNRLREAINSRIASQLNESYKGKIMIFGIGGDMEVDNKFRDIFYNPEEYDSKKRN